ncbi:MAG: hypothetical protein ABFD80_01805, partial [Acidobacteriota bacterium]
MKKRVKSTLTPAAVRFLSGALVLVSALGAAAVWADEKATGLAAPQAKPEMLIVGTFHMANPGHDIFNAKADDVLSPKRQ